MADNMELISRHRCFNGEQHFYRHDSATIGLPMRFSAYLPPQALRGEKCATLLYLAGLTCSEETFVTKAGAQRLAAELGLILIAPDTSPRGANLPGETDDWDFGIGAGFYLDATQAPWDRHYRMYSYLTEELHALLGRTLPIDMKRMGIFGHSMGGHGALVLALKRPDLFRSVSAFAPIAAASDCPWGEKAFSGYLGNDHSTWAAWDATQLMSMQQRAPFPKGILIDQGQDDQFLAVQLHPEKFQAACTQVGQPLTLRTHAGYDHGYYFISTFIGNHLRFHARNLG